MLFDKSIKQEPPWGLGRSMTRSLSFTMICCNSPRALLSAVLYKTLDRRMMNVSDLEFGPLIDKSGRVDIEICALTGR
jgi:hypothetical protein